MLSMQKKVWTERIRTTLVYSVSLFMQKEVQIWGFSCGVWVRALLILGIWWLRCVMMGEIIVSSFYKLRSEWVSELKLCIKRGVHFIQMHAFIHTCKKIRTMNTACNSVLVSLYFQPVFGNLYTRDWCAGEMVT